MAKMMSLNVQFSMLAAGQCYYLNQDIQIIEIFRNSGKSPTNYFLYQKLKKCQQPGENEKQNFQL